ncbi:HEAT repeat domain-containing protein [candidate division KSB1 bacterium]|nr:HEAT repeat domain-containing protein [candidate division KSB1 bacterium]
MIRYNLLLVFITVVFVLTTSLSAKDGEQGSKNINKAWDLKLMRNLDSEKVENRAQAALELAQNGCTIIQDKLIDMAENEERYAARIVAIVALAQVGDFMVLDVLKQRMLDEKRQTVKNVLKGAIIKLEKKQWASL